MPLLQILIASTRPGRVGLPVADWFQARAAAHGGFSVERVDLAAVALPFVDEPNHPRMRRYTQRHTLDWSATIERADAFAFVVPEYNYGMPATLKNAIDFLFYEWNHKPLGFVSYGGVSAGVRSVQMTKQVAGAVGLQVVGPAVSIPFVQQLLSDDRSRIEANEVMDEAADAMLDELLRVQHATVQLRE